MENWEIKEEVVRLLEATISPDSKVERNVQLPNLSSQRGAKCQCDVVIKSGRPPRETISIVEVQYRGTKVDINTFRGWCEKLRDVGAQHLICVSEKGFPDSIIEKAEKMGPSVRLLTLKEIESAEVTKLDFFSNTITNPRRELIQTFDVKLDFKNDSNTGVFPIQFTMDSKDFKYRDVWVSAKDLLFQFLDITERDGAIYGDGKHIVELSLPIENESFSVRIGDEIKEVIRLYLKLEVDILNRTIPITYSQYKQIELEDTQAWLLEAQVFQNDEEVDLKLVFVPTTDGGYRLSFSFF